MSASSKKESVVSNSDAAAAQKPTVFQADSVQSETGFSNAIQIVNHLQIFIDEHISFIRVSLCGLAFVGGTIAVRSLHLFRTFTRLQDIPKDFIIKHKRLHGRVENLTSAGVLLVRHQPIVSTKFSLKNAEPLPVYIVGIRPHSSGSNWMKENLLHETVGFSVLHVNKHGGLDSIVYWKRKVVNELLIRRGMADIENITVTNRDKVSMALIQRLSKAQYKFQKEKERQEWREQWRWKNMKIKLVKILHPNRVWETLKSKIYSKTKQ